MELILNDSAWVRVTPDELLALLSALSDVDTRYIKHLVTHIREGDLPYNKEVSHTYVGSYTRSVIKLRHTNNKKDSYLYKRITGEKYV